MPDVYVIPRPVQMHFLEVGLTQRISKELWNGMTIHASDAADMLSRMMSVGISKRLLSHQVLTDKKDVWFTKDVTVDIPQSRYRRWFRRPVRQIHTQVNGTVTVVADYFKTFPEAQITYPDSLGRSFNLMQIHQETTNG